MNWSEYCKLAARTESIPTIPGLEPTIVRLLHASLGLCTEIEEYLTATSAQNEIEELGDAYWYLAVLDNTFTIPDLQQLPNCDDADAPGPHWVAMLQDICKRVIFYGKPLDNEPNKNYPHGMLNELYLAYWGIIRWIEDETVFHTNLPAPAQLMEANILKLEKRYPDLRFDSTNAIVRNEEKELSHIEVPESVVPVTVEEEKAELVTEPVPPISPKAAMLYYLRNEVTEREAVQGIAAMALLLANCYREAGADCMAEGYKAVYAKVLEKNKLENVLEDGWQMMQQLHTNPSNATVLATIEKACKNPGFAVEEAL